MEIVMATLTDSRLGRIEAVTLKDLKLNPRNARTHSKRQIKLIADSLKAFGFVNPILIDEDGMIVAGHGRVAAAKRIGMAEVPALRIEHLSDDEKRAYVLADNQLAARAGWDPDILAIELQHLIEVDVEFDVTATGFEMPEIDLLIERAKAPKGEDEVQPIDRTGATVTRRGDRWRLGPHRILCADALKMASYATLMGEELATIAFADPPYNVRIAGFVSQSARLAHREFAMAVGEMTEDEFIAFLRSAMACARRFSAAGAVQFWCQDWRHQYELLSAARTAGLEQLNCCVWVKDNGGMGGLYRSRHEFIGVFKVPGAPHRNNVELGKHGRNRTNVWEYPCAPTFSKSSEEGRLNELHPTVKPTGMIADALLDCSNRGDIVLDPFLGSGSTLMAAERTARVCRGVEIDPLYVDVAIRRWQRMTGERAIHVESGIDFVSLELEESEARHER
jgi:DNA modification methylase